MKKLIAAMSAITIFSIGCRGLALPQFVPTSTIPPTWTTSPLPTPSVTDTVQPTLSPTETFTPQPTDTPFPTHTPTPTIADYSQWTLQGPNEVNVPILLYHHIGISPSDSPYYVSPYDFEQQLYLLHSWGYQTVSVETMIAVIKEGGLLPQRPVIITFDDGSESVYSTALPIMQKYDFTGTAYIVHNYIGLTNDFMDDEQILQLYAAGWEIGSHSISHVDLTERTDRQQDEIVDSRIKLERRLGFPILTFAYPFGSYNEDSVRHAHFAGYIGAVGLGPSTLQGNKNLYYLYRIDITAAYDIQTFASFLPWKEEMANLPVLTIVP